MSRRLVHVLLALVAVVAGAAAAFQWVAKPEMRAAAERGLGTSARCTTCHGARGTGGAPSPHTARAEPWSLAAAPDGRTLFVACAGTHSVEQVALPDGGRGETLRFEAAPTGVAVAPDGARLAVSLGAQDRVLILEAATGAVTAAVVVGQDPAGLVWSADGARLVVANAASSDISVVDADAGVETARLPGGREPFAAARSPDGRTLAVVSRRVELLRPEDLPHSTVTLLDGSSGALRRVVTLPSCHMAEGAAFTRDGRFLLVPAILVRNRLPILQVARGWVMSSVLAVVEVASGRVALLPLSEMHAGFADPSGIALTADGARAYVASGGGDQLAEIDVRALLEAAARADADQVQRLSLTRSYLLRRIDVDANPRGVLALADGRVATSARLADRVLLLDPAAGLTRISLGASVAPDATLRGARAFHSARFAFQHAFSCRSCHPGGHTDGLTYDFDIDGVGRNAVLNRSLRGVAGTAPFKWVGSNPTLQRQCGPRFAMVLTRADPMSDAELQDVVAFLHSLRAPPARSHAGRIAGRDTGSAERGRQIFERTVRRDGTPIPPAGRCITCHPPPLYTTRTSADVGTRGPYDSTGVFDIPHLTGIGSKAPYLHDGRAISLEEIWTLPDVGDRHGVVSDLRKADLNDLVEFLRGL